MRKTLLPLLLLITVLLMLLLSPCTASASGAVIKDTTLPYSICDYFSADKFDGCTIYPGGTRIADNTGSGDFYFVITQSEKQNTLYVFKWSTKNQWDMQYKTTAGLMQGTARLHTALDYGTKSANGKNYKGWILSIAQTDADGSYFVRTTMYQLTGGAWKLCYIRDVISNIAMDLKDDGITYYKNADSTKVSSTVQGTVQRNLRYVNLNGIPRTAAEARKKLTVAPVLPWSTRLQAEEVQFTGGKKYNVYSAPMDTAVRGAKGKAVVSTDDWIQVFGTDGDYVMVQYAIDPDHYRIGYISAKSLPKNAKVAPLNLESSHWVYVRGCSAVTDDPFFSQSVLVNLSGEYLLRQLATIGSWTYVEGTDAGAQYRGFVPTVCVYPTSQNEQQNNTQLPDDGYNYAFRDGANGVKYGLFEIVKMHTDASNQVIAVTGSFGGSVIQDGVEVPVGFEKAQRVTFPLAENFTGLLPDGTVWTENSRMLYSDLYQWYTDVFMDNYDGHPLVYSCDLPEDDSLWTVRPDFWSIYTRIQLNDRGEINYMDFVYAPWG